MRGGDGRLPIVNLPNSDYLLLSTYKSTIGNQKSAMRLAERVGFEPTERFPVHSISSAASSTTPAPLQKSISDLGVRISDFCVNRDNNPKSAIRKFAILSGGEGGIRTHGGR